MSKHRSPPEIPACYAMMFPGLEAVAAEEITQRLKGEVKRTSEGVVVFRVAEITPEILRLRTVEDVYLLAWGTNELSFKSDALDHIRRWTAQKPDWQRLLQIHHGIHTRPKGKPSYRLVTQMTGEHGFRRTDAREALGQGLSGHLPASWRYAEENAAVEVWLTITGATAICGLRLSDATMRHRTYKMEHLPASLRPSIAGAMVRLAGARPGHVVLDPMCGAGTILAEQMQLPGRSDEGRVKVWGGDLDRIALQSAGSNLRGLGQAQLARWDARRLPLPDQSVDRIISNPPFGKQLSTPEAIGPLYHQMIVEYDRILRPDGRAVLLVADAPNLHDAAHAVGWKRTQNYRVRVLGLLASLSMWKKGTVSG